VMLVAEGGEANRAHVQTVTRDAWIKVVVSSWGE
jgi:hypothetical protein